MKYRKHSVCGFQISKHKFNRLLSLVDPTTVQTRNSFHTSNNSTSIHTGIEQSVIVTSSTYECKQVSFFYNGFKYQCDYEHSIYHSSLKGTSTNTEHTYKKFICRK